MIMPRDTTVMFSLLYPAYLLRSEHLCLLPIPGLLSASTFINWSVLVVFFLNRNLVVCRKQVAAGSNINKNNFIRGSGTDLFKKNIRNYKLVTLHCEISKILIFTIRLIMYI